MGAKKVTFASADGASPARFYLASAPAHTHERRMEVYTYFNIPENNIVFHMMGQGKETRHLVMQNQERILKDSAYWYRETIRTNGEKLS